jgi:hypothetical protein
LIALVAAILAVAAVGGVLLFKDRTEPSTATPPLASTIARSPATVPPTTVAPTTVTSGDPQTSAPPTTAASTKTSANTTAPPMTSRPATTAAPPTTQPPTHRPSPSPTATAKPPTTPEGVLVRNPLYAQRIRPSDCRQPPRPLPTSRRGEERFLKRVVGCLAQAYAGPIKAAGYALSTPAVVIYTGNVQTRAARA